MRISDDAPKGPAKKKNEIARHLAREKYELEEEWKRREDCENLQNHSKLSEKDKPEAEHHSCPNFFLHGTKQVILLFRLVPLIAKLVQFGTRRRLKQREGFFKAFPPFKLDSTKFSSG